MDGPEEGAGAERPAVTAGARRTYTWVGLASLCRPPAQPERPSKRLSIRAAIVMTPLMAAGSRSRLTAGSRRLAAAAGTEAETDSRAGCSITRECPGPPRAPRERIARARAARRE